MHSFIWEDIFMVWSHIWCIILRRHISTFVLVIIWETWEANFKISTFANATDTTLRDEIYCIYLEVFKSLNGLNPNFMHKMFNGKCLIHYLRDSDSLVSPLFQKRTYGKLILDVTVHTYGTYYQVKLNYIHLLIIFNLSIFSVQFHRILTI